ncbi:MAG: Maf family protein [Gammaproteobacteria bacterium]
MIQSSATPQIVLASASPRRCELLDQIGVRYIQSVVDIDETYQPGESPEKYVLRLALAKAHAVRKRDNNQLPVLGADTTVVIDNEALGKPQDEIHAKAMLKRLSGVSHQVMTAVALVADQEASLTSVTLVRFRPLTDNEISQYWETGEPGDKAGGYAIQGMGAVFVEHIDGSYSGVMGLPLFETARLLGQFGII